MADIVTEVIEDRRDEQKMVLFKKSLPFILIFTILVVIGMILGKSRASKANAHNAEIGDTIIKSLENISTDPSLTLEGLNFVIKNAGNHAKDIAALQLVALGVSSKDNEKTFQFIKDIIDNPGYIELTKAYAKLMWISLMLEKQKLSDEDIGIMKKYFDSYTPATPFYGSAHLLEALWYKKTDKQKSVQIAQNLLSNKQVTPTIKEEAKALLSNLNIEN